VQVHFHPSHAFTTAGKMLDLSFLTEEEYEKLMKVLQRDAELKKKDGDRSIKDEKKKKFVTGEWFSEVKAKRFQEDLEGPDLLRASIRRKKGKLESKYGSPGPLTSPRADPVCWPDLPKPKRKTHGQETCLCHQEAQESCSLGREPKGRQQQPLWPIKPIKVSKRCKLVSGSVLSVYSGDFGSVDAQGTVEFALDYDEKNREFQVHVSQCKDLAVVDEKKGRSDPYVKTYLLPDKARMGKRKTSVKKRTVNPIYNEVLRVRTNTCSENLCYSRQLYQVRSGKILPSFQASNPSSGEVHIWVKDVKDLLQLRPSGVDSFVKCYVLPDTSKKSYQKTRVIKRDTNPIFNHTIVYDGFHTEDLKDACVELTVWDHEKLTNHFLGGIRLGLGTGLSYGISVDWMDSTQEEVAFWQEMMSAANEWIEGLLPLRSLAGRKKLK
uniref:Synaptotagmin like 2 n=1 Tax=Athene cunicularia TaxID=194338 RepID=A0A663M6E1_ATHCN